MLNNDIKNKIQPVIPEADKIQGHKKMKSYRKELWFEVLSRRGFINITSNVEECLHESGIQEGLVLVNTKQI